MNVIRLSRKELKTKRARDFEGYTVSCGKYLMFIEYSSLGDDVEVEVSVDFTPLKSHNIPKYIKDFINKK